MSLADYLAKNYLTADSKIERRSKKRKRKDGSASGLTIADDDALGWDRNGVGSIDNPAEDTPLQGENIVTFYLSLAVPRPDHNQ